MNRTRIRKPQVEYTKEDLKRMGLLHNSDTRPKAELTDESWQVEFELRRKFIKDHPQDKTRLKTNDFEGLTLNSFYVEFINDSLKELKAGETIYCYYIYQIEELLKFHKNTLKTKYMPMYGCWAAWLGKSA